MDFIKIHYTKYASQKSGDLLAARKSINSLGFAYFTTNFFPSRTYIPGFSSPSIFMPWRL